MTELAHPTAPTPVLSYTGFALGGMALIMVIVHFFAGPFAPQQDLSVSLGELASDITKSAFRDFFGMAQPGAEPLPWDIDRILKAATGVAAALAILLGCAALLRHENRRAAIFAASLGVSAIAIQLFATAVAMIVCALIIAAFLSALGDFIPFVGD